MRIPTQIAVAAVLSIAAGFALATLRPDPPAAAGTTVRLELDELVQHARLVLEARVLDARVLVEPGGRIVTEYELATLHTWWGEDLPTRVVRLPGGVLPDGSGLWIPGVPRLAVGERAILFLSAPSAGGMRMPVGLFQGRMRVVRTSSGAPLVAVDGPEGLAGGRDYAAVRAELEAAAAARRARAAETDGEGK